jgi:glutaredoxin-like protein
VALLDTKVAQQVKTALKDVTVPVTLKVFTQEFECDYCKETRQLAEEVAAQSPYVKVEVYDFVKDKAVADSLGIDKIPAMAVVGAKDYGIRLFGIPTGYEFSTLIEAIKLAAQGESGLSAETKKMVARLARPVTIQVMVTPTCPYCPQAVNLAHRLAVESELITGHMVEVSEFPQIANKYQVMGVPRSVVGETIYIDGAVPEPQFMREFAKLIPA